MTRSARRKEEPVVRWFEDTGRGPSFSLSFLGMRDEELVQHNLEVLLVSTMY